MREGAEVILTPIRAPKANGDTFAGRDLDAGAAFAEALRKVAKPLHDEVEALHDLVLDLLRCPLRARARPARARIEPGLALGIEPPAELVDPPW